MPKGVDNLATSGNTALLPRPKKNSAAPPKESEKSFESALKQARPRERSKPVEKENPAPQPEAEANRKIEAATETAAETESPEPCAPCDAPVAEESPESAEEPQAEVTGATDPVLLALAAAANATPQVAIPTADVVGTDVEAIATAQEVSAEQVDQLETSAGKADGPLSVPSRPDIRPLNEELQGGDGTDELAAGQEPSAVDDILSLLAGTEAEPEEAGDLPTTAQLPKPGKTLAPLSKTNVDVAPNSAESAAVETEIDPADAVQAIQPVDADAEDPEADPNLARDPSAAAKGTETVGVTPADVQPAVATEAPVLKASDGTRPTSPPQPTPMPVRPEAEFASTNHDRIVTSVRSELMPKGGTMHLRLDPPELGVLQVTVRMVDGNMTAAFETSNEQASRLLSHSLGQLKQALESQGVSVDKLHVAQAPRDQQAGNSNDEQQRQTQSDAQSSRHEQQRKEMIRRMWAKLGVGDPLDLVA